MHKKELGYDPNICRFDVVVVDLPAVDLPGVICEGDVRELYLLFLISLLLYLNNKTVLI